jgi:host factor-I protein
MASQGESRQPPGQSIQDLFLNGARRHQLAVTIQLMDGKCVDATIKNFDRFSIVVDQGGCDQLIFKHAIAVIRPANAIRASVPTT